MAEIFTVVEVAAKLKVSDDIVYRLVKTGKIVASRVEGQWRIDEQAIRDYLDSVSNKQGVTAKGGVLSSIRGGDGRRQAQACG